MSILGSACAPAVSCTVYGIHLRRLFAPPVGLQVWNSTRSSRTFQTLSCADAPSIPVVDWSPKRHADLLWWDRVRATMDCWSVQALDVCCRAVVGAVGLVEYSHTSTSCGVVNCP